MREAALQAQSSVQREDRRSSKHGADLHVQPWYSSGRGLGETAAMESPLRSWARARAAANGEGPQWGRGAGGAAAYGACAGAMHS